MSCRIRNGRFIGIGFLIRACAIADDEQGGTQDPTHGIGQSDGDEAEPQGFGDGEVDLTENDKGQQHDDRRGRGVPDPPERAGVCLIEADGDIERGHQLDETDAVFDHFRLRGEKAQQLSGREESHDGEGHRGGKTQPDGFPDALLGAVLSLGAPVLPHHGGAGHGNGLHGNQHEGVQLIVDGVAGHTRRTEGVAKYYHLL